MSKTTDPTHEPTDAGKGDSLASMVQALRKFSAERNWGQFHSPKNLAIAIAVEAAELLEQFQWLTEEQSHNLSKEHRVAVADEVADVQIYLVQLADKLGLDVGRSVEQKMKRNAEKYPVEIAFGNATKRRTPDESTP